MDEDQSDEEVDDDCSDSDAEELMPDEATAKLVHAEQIKSYVKEGNREKSLAPQIYATLRSNISEESIQLLSQEERLIEYESLANYVGLFKLIRSTHSSAKQSKESIKETVIYCSFYL